MVSGFREHPFPPYHLVPIHLCNGGPAKTDPGTSYVLYDGRAQTLYDFSLAPFRRARMIISALGNEAGSGKGLCVYNVTDGQMICEVTWDGSVRVDCLASNWVPINLRVQKQLAVYVKGSSATEDITPYHVELQLRCN